MATESPIRMLERTKKWVPLKQSTRFGSSSSKITIKDLGLLINDQRFQSFEKDVIPSRCESAPPSMEGSKEAVESMFSHQKSTFEPSFALRGREPFVPICSTDIDGKTTSHAKRLDDPEKSARNILPVHEEESEDDGSSEQNSSLSNEKAAFLGYHSGSVDATRVCIISIKDEYRVRCFRDECHIHCYDNALFTVYTSCIVVGCQFCIHIFSQIFR